MLGPPDTPAVDLSQFVPQLRREVEALRRGGYATGNRYLTINVKGLVAVGILVVFVPVAYLVAKGGHANLLLGLAISTCVSLSALQFFLARRSIWPVGSKVETARRRIEIPGICLLLVVGTLLGLFLLNRDRPIDEGSSFGLFGLLLPCILWVGKYEQTLRLRYLQSLLHFVGRGELTDSLSKPLSPESTTLVINALQGVLDSHGEHIDDLDEPATQDP